MNNKTKSTSTTTPPQSAPQSSIGILANIFRKEIKSHYKPKPKTKLPSDYSEFEMQFIMENIEVANELLDISYQRTNKVNKAILANPYKYKDDIIKNKAQNYNE